MQFYFPYSVINTYYYYYYTNHDDDKAKAQRHHEYVRHALPAGLLGLSLLLVFSISLSLSLSLHPCSLLALSLYTALTIPHCFFPPSFLPSLPPSLPFAAKSTSSLPPSLPPSLAPSLPPSPSLPNRIRHKLDKPLPIILRGDHRKILLPHVIKTLHQILPPLP